MQNVRVAEPLLGGISVTDFFDFNTADDQLSEPSINGKDVVELKQRLLDRLPILLAALFSNGKKRGSRFVVGDLGGNKGKSLVIELEGEKAGLWTDFATGEGGDVMDLWARYHGLDVRLDFTAVIKGISTWLGTASYEPASTPVKKSSPIDELGMYSNKWDYHDRDGKLIACVYRYDLDDGSKEFRPLDVTTGKKLAPNPRPLYNQPGIFKSNDVVIVEGEKCADALITNGICATTAMNGSNAPVEKTDWSPLKNKNVLIWPDKDSSGWAYAEKVQQHLSDICTNVCIAIPPEEKPEKWDAADAVGEGFDIEGFVASVEKKRNKASNVLVIEDWLACERFKGEPKEREWLVDSIFPMAQVSLIAASGGVGKSFLLAELARAVASFNGFQPTAPCLFGGSLRVKGTAVYFTAEDDFIEMHNRLNSLGDIPDNLYVLPLPDMGGARPMFAPDPASRSPSTTPFWKSVTEQLINLPDLRVIIFDPLQPLCALDFNVPENAQFVCSHLSALAAQTGASVIVSHHFAKREAATPEQAREAIRGSGGLVDGVRCAYALWLPPVDRAKSICQQLGREYSRNGVVMGGVVKANGRANLNVTVFVRDDEVGVLRDSSSDLASKQTAEVDLLSMLLDAVSIAAHEGKPYTKTGLNGVYERRFELPNPICDFSKHKLVALVETLEKEDRLVKGMAPGSTSVKWLDVPDGPVSMGTVKFVPGHLGKAINGKQST